MASPSSAFAPSEGYKAKYDEGVWLKVVALVSEGNTFSSIGKKPGMPSDNGIRKRLQSNAEFAAEIEKAKAKSRSENRPLSNGESHPPESWERVVELVASGVSIPDIDGMPGLPSAVRIRARSRTDPRFGDRLKNAKMDGRDDDPRDDALFYYFQNESFNYISNSTGLDYKTICKLVCHVANGRRAQD